MRKLPSEMSKEGKKRNAEHKEQQVEQLINIVEDHTRTQRHLEQYSDFGDPDNIDHARGIQNKREELIDELKTAIVDYGQADN